ncbi:MauE/DoxX family redox-associated membrane protein [Novosphingobium sp.]|uniref:MauE/DoxX family redox-associated membrane protein n=1 Tax=Novosphingobium sp. TaxID=1874826 RepID=UPI00261EFA7B|nr:MauE/DoxX family redox-associated membrane protein [Novosphingobium sp.]
MADGGALTLAVLGGTGLSVLGYAGAVGVGLVFLGAGQAKLRHTDLLGGVIANYRLLPTALVAPVAAVLPWLELVVGIGLMIGTWLFAPVAIGLLVIFAAAMGINIVRGRREIDCGCGRSDLRQPLSWLLVGRNLALAALLALCLVFVPETGLAPMDRAVAYAGGIAVYLLYLLFNAIGALAASPLAAQRR